MMMKKKMCLKQNNTSKINKNVWNIPGILVTIYHNIKIFPFLFKVLLIFLSVTLTKIFKWNKRLLLLRKYIERLNKNYTKWNKTPPLKRTNNYTSDNGGNAVITRTPIPFSSNVVEHNNSTNGQHITRTSIQSSSNQKTPQNINTPEQQSST